jgi:hypothetical protein
MTTSTTAADAPADDSLTIGRDDPPETGQRPSERASDLVFCCGRYWDRTSDLFGVNEALSR